MMGRTLFPGAAMRKRNQKPTILIVDDEPDSREALGQVMQGEGYRVLSAGDGVEALEAVAAHDVDLVLMDLQMPRMNGEEACRRLKGDPRTRLIPVVMHTGVNELGSRLRAHDQDADDYLLKGSSMAELKARVRSLLRLKRYTDDLESAAAVLTTVARIVERRDHYVREHCKEVSEICTKLGLRLGLDADTLARLQLGATFHDIGKIVIGDAILQKQGPLDEAERGVMMTHAAIGSDLVEPMRSLSDVAPLIRHHHEKLDGSPRRPEGRADQPGGAGADRGRHLPGAGLGTALQEGLQRRQGHQHPPGRGGQGLVGRRGGGGPGRPGGGGRSGRRRHRLDPFIAAFFETNCIFDSPFPLKIRKPKTTYE
jgi:putative two-component system response regulator